MDQNNGGVVDQKSECVAKNIEAIEIGDQAELDQILSQLKERVATITSA